MSKSPSSIRPLVYVSIRPLHNDDREKLQSALVNIAGGDPLIWISTETEDRETRIAGVGESHLQIIHDRVVREYGIELNVGKPQVIYLETIRESSAAEGKYIGRAGGRDQYAHVKMRVEPRERGSGYEFVDQSPNGAVPLQFMPYVESGIREAIKTGVYGYEMVDLRAILCDGSYHEQDSSALAFRTASSMAFRDAARRACPVVLEPTMLVRVKVAEELMGFVIGDLNARRGRIEGIELVAGSQVITAIAPLSGILGYPAYLAQSTQRRAVCEINFARYEVVRHRPDSGDENAGVTANKPRMPRPNAGSAAAQRGVDDES